MNSYDYYNYCTKCKRTYDKKTIRCRECNQKLRTKPKGQYAKKHPELIRI